MIFQASTLTIPSPDSNPLPSEIMDNPWVVYVLVGLAILGILAAFVRRESEHWGKWLANLRRAREDRDDIVIKGLREDLDRMQGRIDQSEQSHAQDYARLHNRIEETNRRMQQYRTERDALVTYLREWWNWALAGAEGPPPPVPEWLKHLLPEESWTWRPEYLRRPGQSGTVADRGDEG